MEKNIELKIEELTEKIDRLSSLILTQVVSPPRDETYKKTGSRLISVKQASYFLGVSASTVQNLVKTRKITCYKHSGKIVFDEKDLKKYLLNTKVESIHDSIEKAANRGR